MINAEALALMKPGAYLINTARAALIDDQALIDALESGHLGGAALDVFAVEPPGSDDPLLQFENVIATPHIGGNTYEVGAHQGHIVAGELRRLLQGKRTTHLLNPKAMARFSWTGEKAVSQETLDELAHTPGPGVSDLQIDEQRGRETAATQPPQTPPQAPHKKEENKGGLLGGIKKLFGGEGDDEKPPTQTTAAGGEVAENMRNVLEDFLARITRDEKLTNFSQGKEVVMRFLLSDMEQVFYLSFLNGVVDAGLGEPPGEHDVSLKMAADTLDGMFTGRIGGMKAAMTGKLSFSGDTGKAMAFQRIQNDMNRLYLEAREEIGDPGDLTQIGATPLEPAPSAPQPQPAGDYMPPHQGVAGYITGIPSPIRQLGDIRDEIVAVTTELFHAELITATGGNVSARIPGKPNEIWMTPSQIFKGDLQPEMMVRIDLDGNPLEEDSLTASSERRVHCAVYRRRPDVEVVIHTHAPWATILALAELPFLPVSTEAAFFDDLPRVPFIMPGTEELGEAVGEVMRTGAACLMQNHGLVVAGSSLRRAADLTYIIEVTAHKLVECAKLGIEPPNLPPDVVEQLREIGKLMA
jgi:autoinducer 2 (AI-2) kinase